MTSEATPPDVKTVMDRSVLPRFRMAGAVLLAAILVTACDTWPFGSADPTLTWESSIVEVLYPLGHVDVERESGSIHLQGQFELPVGRIPSARLVHAEPSVVIHVDTEACDCYTIGMGSWRFDFSAAISGLGEGRHVVRMVVERPSHSDTIFNDTVSVP